MYEHCASRRINSFLPSFLPNPNPLGGDSLSSDTSSSNPTIAQLLCNSNGNFGNDPLSTDLHLFSDSDLAEDDDDDDQEEDDDQDNVSSNVTTADPVDVTVALTSDALKIIEDVADDISDKDDYIDCTPLSTLFSPRDMLLQLYCHSSLPIGVQNIQDGLNPLADNSAVRYDSLKVVSLHSTCFNISMYYCDSSKKNLLQHDIAKLLMSVQYVNIVGWPDGLNDSWMVMIRFKDSLREVPVSYPKGTESLDSWFTSKLNEATSIFTALSHEITVSSPCLSDVPLDNWSKVSPHDLRWSPEATPWIIIFSLKKNSERRFKNDLGSHLMSNWDRELRTFKLSGRYYVCFPSPHFYKEKVCDDLMLSSRVSSYMLLDKMGTYAAKVGKNNKFSYSEFSPYVSYDVERNLKILYDFKNNKSLQWSFRTMDMDHANESPANSDWIRVKPFILLVFSEDVAMQWVGGVVKNCFTEVSQGSSYHYRFTRTRTSKNLYSFKVKCSEKILSRLSHRIQEVLKIHCPRNINVRVSDVKGYYQNNGRDLRRPFKPFQNCVKFGTLNVTTLNNRFHTFTGLMDIHHLDYMALQETHRDNSSPALPDSEFYFTENKPDVAVAGLVGVAAISRERSRIDVTYDGTPNLAVQIIHQDKGRPIMDMLVIWFSWKFFGTTTVGNDMGYNRMLTLKILNILIAIL